MRHLQQYDAGVLVSIPVRDEQGASLDLDGSEDATLLLEGPSGRRKALAATVNASADAVERLTLASDFDEWGVWRAQALLHTNAFELRSTVVRLEVLANLDSPRLVLTPSPCLALLGLPPVAVVSLDASGGPGVPFVEDLAVRQDPELEMAAVSLSSTDWLRTGTDQTWIEDGPEIFVPYPRLREVGVYWFLIEGDFTNDSSPYVGQQIDLELMVDDVASGFAFRMADVANIPAAGVGGHFKFDVTLSVKSDPAGAVVHVVHVKGYLNNETDATVATLAAIKRFAFDPTADHRLRWRLRKHTASGPSTLRVRDWVGRPLARRSAS